MKLNELFLAQLEREIPATRKVIERVPDGRNDWKPHPKSMPLGYLADLVATIPRWAAMIVNLDEYTIDPQGQYATRAQDSNRELRQRFEVAIAEAREALAGTNDGHLLKPWRLLVGGHVVSEQPRHVMISDSSFSHLAHHRGQLTVYLRLNEVPVPAVYGPSADDGGF